MEATVLLTLIFSDWLLIDVLSDEELLLFLLSLHIECLWGREDVYVYFISRCGLELLFYISIWPDLGNGESHSLVHHFHIQVVSLNLLILCFTGEQLDGIGVGEGRPSFLLLLSPQIVLGACPFFVDYDC